MIDSAALCEQRTLFSSNTDSIFMIVMSIWKRPHRGLDFFKGVTALRILTLEYFKDILNPPNIYTFLNNLGSWLFQQVYQSQRDKREDRNVK